MARRAQITRQARLQAAEAQLLRPRRVLVQTELIVHVPGDGTERCPCCGSRWAQISRREPRWQLLIDVRKHRRWLRFHEDIPAWAYDKQDVLAPGDFDRVAKGAHVVEMPIRCTDRSFALIRDHSTKIRGATGGARSSKTQTICLWAAEEWILTGGTGSQAWIAGPELQHALILRDKLVVGEPNNPPIIPEDLVVSYPQSQRDPEKHIILIDGSKIRLQHLKGDGSNLSGRGVDWIVVTELAAARERKNWARLRGRIVSHGGRLAYDRVPEPRHWSKDATVARSEKEDIEEIEAAREGKPYERTIRNEHFSSADNPWNDPEESAAFIKELEEIDPRLAAREGRGEEIGDADLVFGDAWDASRLTFETEGWDVSGLPGGKYVDITRQASLKWFSTPKDWLAGCDVNWNPVTFVFGKIFTLEGKDPRNELAWQLALFLEWQIWDRGVEVAAKELPKIFGGRFSGAGIVMDATACLDRRSAQKRGSRVAKLLFEEQGFEVRGPDRWPDTGKWKNPWRYDRSLMQRRMMRDQILHVNRGRCQKLMNAYRDQEAESDGITPVKTSNTYADRNISCLVEASGYLAWPFFSRANIRRFDPNNPPRRDFM